MLRPVPALHHRGNIVRFAFHSDALEYSADGPVRRDPVLRIRSGRKPCQGVLTLVAAGARQAAVTPDGGRASGGALRYVRAPCQQPVTTRSASGSPRTRGASTTGGAGARISPSASGARCARI